MRSAAVELDLSRTARRRNGLGLDPLAIVYVPHRDFLARPQVGALHQVLINGNRADVMYVSLGHRGPVESWISIIHVLMP